MDKFLTTSNTWFQCSDGKQRKIGECMIYNERRPSTNWVVEFSINGIRYETEGGRRFNSQQTMQNQLEVNGFPNAFETAWATCNYSWLINARPANRMMPPEEFLGLCTEIQLDTDKIKEQVVNDREYQSPDFWGSHSWAYMGHELGMDDFQVVAYRRLIERELQKVSSAKNPSRGCDECFTHFSVAVQEYRQNVKDIKGARYWFMKTHNSVRSRRGKQEFTQDEMNKYYGWD